MLKAVTFDLWGTLIKETPDGSRWSKAERIRKINEILREEQIILNLGTIAQAYDTEGERLEELWKTGRDIGARTQVELLLDILQVGGNVPRSDSLMVRLVDAYTLPILSAMPVPLDGAADILETLNARGLRLALICNTGRTPGKILRIILARIGLAGHLRAQTYSDEIGFRKPHPEIFKCTLVPLEVEPSEALHVGDTPAADVIGARAIGMHAVHLCRVPGADARCSEVETISSLQELLPLIDRKLK